MYLGVLHPPLIIKNSLIGSGYRFKDGANYKMEVETESEFDWLFKY